MNVAPVQDTRMTPHQRYGNMLRFSAVVFFLLLLASVVLALGEILTQWRTPEQLIKVITNPEPPFT